MASMNSLIDAIDVYSSVMLPISLYNWQFITKSRDIDSGNSSSNSCYVEYFFKSRISLGQPKR